MATAATQSARRTASDTADKFILRLYDEGLRKHLKVRAARNDRTLNGEILYLLKRGLAAEGDPFHVQPEGAAQ